MSRRLRFFCLAALLLSFGAGLFAASAARAADGKARTKLFGTVEFRASMRALSHWLSVLERAEGEVAALSACDPGSEECSAASLAWQKIQAEAAGGTFPDRLRRVNTFFNRWPYRLDRDVYGQSDYWATPAEFLRRSGDCEDFAIAKYFALRQLGLAAESMRIVVVRDTIRNISHAVLAVYRGQDIYILDSLSDLVLSHDMYEHYRAQYSVNEFHRWAHIRPVQ